jgi:hypothetical protein
MINKRPPYFLLLLPIVKDEIFEREKGGRRLIHREKSRTQSYKWENAFGWWGKGKINIPPPLLFSFSWVLIDDTNRSPTDERRTQERRNQTAQARSGLDSAKWGRMKLWLNRDYSSFIQFKKKNNKKFRFCISPRAVWTLGPPQQCPTVPTININHTRALTRLIERGGFFSFFFFFFFFYLINITRNLPTSLFRENLFCLILKLGRKVLGRAGCGIGRRGWRGGVLHQLLFFREELVRFFFFDSSNHTQQLFFWPKKKKRKNILFFE